MSITASSRAKAEQLYQLSGELLQAIKSHMKWQQSKKQDASAVIDRYMAILRRGLDTDDTEVALRGARSLTTVNKGISDLIEEDGDFLADMASNVQDRAIETSRALEEQDDQTL